MVFHPAGNVRQTERKYLTVDALRMRTLRMNSNRSSETMRISRPETQLDLSRGNAPTWRVLIGKDFNANSVSAVIGCPLQNSTCATRRRFNIRRLMRPLATNWERIVLFRLDDHFDLNHLGWRACRKIFGIWQDASERINPSTFKDETLGGVAISIDQL
jgi:hypothetical protein